MLNNFLKFGDFFTHQSFYHTVVYYLLIYACLIIYSEKLLLLHPLIARLSTEKAASVSFRLPCCQSVCFWMHSDVHFCFSSLSFSLLSASLSFFAARRSLSFAHFCFSHSLLAIQLFTSHSCRCCQLLSRFLVPSLASHSFTSASSACLSLTSAFHIQFRLIVILRVLQESYKSRYRPARYPTNFLLLCTVH